MKPVIETELSGLTRIAKGKVRDIYAVDDDHLLFVTTDRISAFDVVLPDPVPHKGIVLTQLSLFWFELLGDSIDHHVVAHEMADMPAAVRAHADLLRGRTLLVKKAKIFPVECILRGYLLGSGWKDYQASGAVCGIPLPTGLKKNHRFEPALFTPSTKAEQGLHDENISFARMEEILGAADAKSLAERSTTVFERGRTHARERGIIICDTKFEWGRAGDRILLVDEVMTPDSSRFWRLEDAESALEEGQDPPSYDKQVVRDWLETQDWDKTPPGPRVPEDVARLARARYLEIYERLTGRPVPFIDENE